jgi:hypothetical protein
MSPNMTMMMIIRRRVRLPMLAVLVIITGHEAGRRSRTSSPLLAVAVPVSAFTFRAILAPTDHHHQSDDKHESTPLQQEFYKGLAQRNLHLRQQQTGTPQQSAPTNLKGQQVVFSTATPSTSDQSTGTELCTRPTCTESIQSLYLNTLPVSKIRIVVSEWLLKKQTMDGNFTEDYSDDNVDSESLSSLFYSRTINEEISTGSMKDQIEAAVLLWIDFGNVMDTNATFSLSTSSTIMTTKQRRKRTRKKTNIDQPQDQDHKIEPFIIGETEFTSSIVKEIRDQFGWGRVAQQPSLEFHLVQCSRNHYQLELTALTRTYPLKDKSGGKIFSPLPTTALSSDATDLPVEAGKTSERDTRSIGRAYRQRLEQKRIESFIVARAADIQPGDCILDPMCGRATFLVEAAKYWPLTYVAGRSDSTGCLAAHYFGVDSSIPHLQHAKMNADSTCTILELRQGSPFSLPYADFSMDKIITCLPFARSTNYYRGLLQEWSRVLKQHPTTSGKMILVIDQPTLDRLVEVVHSVAGCSVAFVRSSFTWGNDRAAIVVVERNGKTGTNLSSRGYPQGMFEWEAIHGRSEDKLLGSSMDRSNWIALRSRTYPPMVPFAQAQLARSAPTKIILINNK